MNQFKENLKGRTTTLAVMVVQRCNALPNTLGHITLGRQLARSITSIGANYRAACRAKSRPDFINKFHIVEEECDESISHWIEILEMMDENHPESWKTVKKELNEILAIVVTALKTAKQHKSQK